MSQVSDKSPSGLRPPPPGEDIAAGLMRSIFRYSEVSLFGLVKESGCLAFCGEMAIPS
uniref:hypothetical protein n=1 Tax=Roseivirga sp. TaxID=1964215 RepID=UPI004048056D